MACFGSGPELLSLLVMKEEGRGGGGGVEEKERRKWRCRWGREKGCGEGCGWDEVGGV